MVDNSVESSFVPENQWSCTEMKVSKSTYTWTIKNLKFFKDEDVLISLPFYVGGKNGSKWQLELHPKNAGCSLYLRLETCQKPAIKAKYTFSIVTPERTQETNGTFHKDGCSSFKPGSSGGFSSFIHTHSLFDEAKGFVHGDKLTILCEVHVLDDIVKIPAHDYVVVPECQLLHDFEMLFENETFSDVTLAAGVCGYRVHKAILAARSKVFAGMFTHDMEENRSNHVNIADIGADVCKEMLHFIYTGKAPNLHKVADGLLAAAEKYELTKLKAMCEEALTLKLNVENAAATLILADLHSADQLKAQTVNFISIHTFEVLQTEGWKNLSSSHLPLLMETFLAIEKSKSCQSNSNK